MPSRVSGGVAATVLVIACAAPALADDKVPVPDVATLDLGRSADATPQWIVTLGVGVSLGPDYEGAKGLGFTVLPSDFSIRHADEPRDFSAPDDGFDISLLDLGPLSIGPVADLRGGRSRSDNRKLAGLDNIPWTFDAGLFAEYWILEDRLRTRIEVRQALRSGQGLVADLFADWVQPYGAFTASIGPRMSIGNGAYMRTSFGVTDEEAALSPYLGAFDASAGIKSVGAAAALRYDFSPSWSGTIYDRFDRLVGDAADSPITSVIGTRNQNTVGISLSYSFGVKL